MAYVADRETVEELEVGSWRLEIELAHVILSGVEGEAKNPDQA